MARKQRQFTAQFKLERVLEVLKGEKPIAPICRERQVTDSLVYKWRGEFLEKAAGIFEGEVSNSQASQTNGRIAELERLVGQRTMTNALLKIVPKMAGRTSDHLCYAALLRWTSSDS
jgi:transposase-like protein